MSKDWIPLKDPAAAGAGGILASRSLAADRLCADAGLADIDDELVQAVVDPL